MCTKIAPFDVDNAPKNYETIIDLGPYKGKGVGYDWVGAFTKKYLSIICHNAAH